ncbi:hypothetical protein SAMN05444359_1514 [Neolewinella agarilytica]|uniref:Uncharacterized protein n=1 Tax=Neolewinella agarilytica TaxID=478744 RepID=A0A1H9PHJ0_9BACT|nr:hypothetical protein SAMN05444359_1514 [Neolewinella agarilytica]
MKFLKYFSLFFVGLLLSLFLIFGVEYGAGSHYSNGEECIIASGQKEVYVHWFVPMNNMISDFCDGSLTPRYYEAKEKCNCVD